MFSLTGLIPDIIPVLGWLDDIGVLALLVKFLSKPEKTES